MTVAPEAEVIDPQEISDALAFSAFLEGCERDPLKGYRPNCKAAGDMIRLSQRVAELWVLFIYWRAGNSSGKTWNAAAMFTAIARGMRSLGGIMLPAIRCPNIGYVIPETKSRQVDSSQAAYLHWIGNWPHKIAWAVGETKGIIERIYLATARCEHGNDAKCKYCSQIVFHSADSGPLEAVKIDWAHGDEIPPWNVWDSVMARFSVGRPFLMAISGTPLYRRDWAWIADYFKEQDVVPGTIINGRVELRSSILDNIYLPKGQADALLQQWAGNELERARILGEYVDTEGECPFNLAALNRWKARDCVRAPEVEHITIQSEQNFDDGRYTVSRVVAVEVFEKPRPECHYLAVLDPSSGVRSKEHDPAGILLFRRGPRPALVLRFNDYLEPYGLGFLASILGNRYGEALLDVDMTGGYGANTVTALSQRGYFNLVRDYHEDRPGQMSPRFGFTITSVNRSEITTAIERALLEDSIEMPSAAVIGALSGITVDKKDKWLAAPGRHDEDMICLGRALHLMATLPTPPPKTIEPEQRLAALLRTEGMRYVGEADEPTAEDLWI